MENEHIVKKFDKSLGKMMANILEMGELVGLQIRDAMAVLRDFDASEVDRIRAFDLQVNGLDKAIHTKAEQLIARRQPMALDLRKSLASINIAGELERIGDHAKSTAKRAHVVRDMDPQIDQLEQMSNLVRTMLTDVLVAYENSDATLAAALWDRDREVDDLYDKLVDSTIVAIQDCPEKTENYLHITLIGRNFERIGDHVVNISRYVQHIVTGEDPKAS